MPTTVVWEPNSGNITSAPDGAITPVYIIDSVPCIILYDTYYEDWDWLIINHHFFYKESIFGQGGAGTHLSSLTGYSTGDKLTISGQILSNYYSPYGSDTYTGIHCVAGTQLGVTLSFNDDTYSVIVYIDPNPSVDFPHPNGQDGYLYGLSGHSQDLYDSISQGDNSYFSISGTSEQSQFNVSLLTPNNYLQLEASEARSIYVTKVDPATLSFSVEIAESEGRQLSGINFSGCMIPEQYDGSPSDGGVGFRVTNLKLTKAVSVLGNLSVTDEDGNILQDGDSISFGQITTYNGQLDTVYNTWNNKLIQIHHHCKRWPDVIANNLPNGNKYSSSYTAQVDSIRNTLSNTSNDSPEFILTGRHKMDYVYFIPPSAPLNTSAKYKDLMFTPSTLALTNGTSGVLATISVYDDSDLSTDLYNSTASLKKPVLLKVVSDSAITAAFINPYTHLVDELKISYYTTNTVQTKFGVSRQQTVSNAKTVSLVANNSRAVVKISEFLAAVNVRIVRDVKNLGVYIPKYFIDTIDSVKKDTILEITRNADTGGAEEFSIPSVTNTKKRLRTLSNNYPVGSINQFPPGYTPASNFTNTFFSASFKKVYHGSWGVFEQLNQSYIIFPKGIMTGISPEVSFIYAELLGVDSSNKVDMNAKGVPCVYGAGWLDRTKDRAVYDVGKNSPFALQFYNITTSSSKQPTSATLPKFAFIRLVFLTKNYSDYISELIKETGAPNPYSGLQHQIYPITTLAKTSFAYSANNKTSHNNHSFKFVGDNDGVGSFATGFTGNSNFRSDGTLDITTENGQYAYVVSQCNWDIL